MNQNFYSNSGYILVTDFDENIKDKIEQDLRGYTIVWFNYKSLLLEHISEVVEEIYLTEEFQKYIIIETKKLSNVTQNSLLKLFEEPPKNITFILIVPSKSIVLPTIRSRLLVKYFDNSKKIELNIEIPKISSLDLNKLHNFLEESKRLTAVESRFIVEQILKENIKYPFIPVDFDRFKVASQLLNLNSSSSRVFLMLLLPFVNRNRSKLRR